MTERREQQSFESRGLRIGVFVIAFDADSMITETLGRVPEEIWKAITVLFVIDDCSRDQTVERALSFDRHREKIVVLRNRVSQHYGGNQKIGYQYALDHNLDAVALLHADGKFAPECLRKMLEPIVRGDADVVLGSRMLERGKAIEAGMLRHKYWGNLALSRLQNAFSGMCLSEFHSGYRAYRTSFLSRIPFWENADEWHFDTQILLQARQAGAKIVEVPTPTFYSERIGHIRGLGYGLNCLSTTVAYYLHCRGILYSRNYDLAIRGRKYFEKFNDPASSHSRIWAWLRNRGVQGKSVLELGVGDASLTQRIFEAGAIVDGIEIDTVSADLARPYCRSVMVNDLDDIQNVKLRRAIRPGHRGRCAGASSRPGVRAFQVEKARKNGGILGRIPAERGESLRAAELVIRPLPVSYQGNPGPDAPSFLHSEDRGKDARENRLDCGGERRDIHPAGDRFSVPDQAVLSSNDGSFPAFHRDFKGIDGIPDALLLPESEPVSTSVTA